MRGMCVWMCVVHGILHEGEEYDLDDCKQTGLVKFSSVSGIHRISDQMTHSCRCGLANRKPPIVEGLDSGW